MAKNEKPLDPKTQAVVDEFAKRLAERLLEEGVESDELVRIDERVLPLVRRIGGKTIEEMAKKKVDSVVKENEELGLKVHRTTMIEFEYIFGRVEIESPYMWLKDCGSIRPTSELLGLNARGRSELVKRALTDFGAEESFGQASKRFEEHYGWAIGRTSILRVVESEAVRAEAFVERKLEEQLQTYEATETVKKGIGTILVELDGCEIRTGKLAPAPGGGVTPIHKNPSRVRTTEWRDVRDGMARPMGSDTALCVSGLKPYPDIVRQLLGVACLAGLTDQTTVVGVTDGGNGLREELAVQLPNFIHILDKPHLASHLNEAADAAGKSNRERYNWVSEKLKQCHQGAAVEVIEECQKHRGRGKKRATQLGRYINKFKDSVNYDEFEKKGYPIGSGEGESLHRTLSQKRMKLPGAWWSEQNVNPMLALRVIRQNNWWDEFWAEKAPNHQRNQPVDVLLN
jgi:hypothetical protein